MKPARAAKLDHGEGYRIEEEDIEEIVAKHGPDPAQAGQYLRQGVAAQPRSTELKGVIYHQDEAIDQLVERPSA